MMKDDDFKDIKAKAAGRIDLYKGEWYPTVRAINFERDRRERREQVRQLAIAITLHKLRLNNEMMPRVSDLDFP